VNGWADLVKAMGFEATDLKHATAEFPTLFSQRLAARVDQQNVRGTPFNKQRVGHGC